LFAKSQVTQYKAATRNSVGHQGSANRSLSKVHEPTMDSFVFQMTTPRQIRAARALLGLDAAELADRAGLTRATVTNIENSVVQPREATLVRLVQTLVGGGVEFIGERGVALMSENYRLIEGADCYLRLLDEIYHSLRTKPGSEVLSICTDDNVSPPEVRQAIQRWHDAGIKCRFLSHEKATHFDFPVLEYRLIPSHLFTNSVMVVFDDKVATLRGLNAAVLVITDRDQADMLRGLFEMIWSQSPAPGKTAS
jgi:transcriptional regulator with XRE-family HTH domain